MGERLRTMVGRDLGVWLISGAFLGAALINLLQIGWAMFGGWFVPMRVWISFPFFLGMAILYPAEVARGGEPAGFGLRLTRVIVGGLGIAWFLVREVLGTSRMLSATALGALIGAAVIYVLLRSRRVEEPAAKDESGWYR